MLFQGTRSHEQPDMAARHRLLNDAACPKSMPRIAANTNPKVTAVAAVLARIFIYRLLGCAQVPAVFYKITEIAKRIYLEQNAV